MLTARLLTEELLAPDLPAQSSHPRDVSRLLLGLMALSRKAEESHHQSGNDGLGDVISKSVLRTLLSALHFRDVATVRHSRRVAMLAVGMARFLGWELSQQKVLEVAAILHDIGKIGVPDNILFKPGKLSPDEAELMSLHHNIGVDVLQACRVDMEVLEIVVQAHCNFDGESDRSRKIGGEIHQGARILAVADAYDSMSTDQVYRKGRSHAEIMNVLMEAGGTQFDGNVVCALSRWIEGEGLPFEQGSGDLKSAKPPGPVHPEEALEASSLGHIFSYLYVLESLYDGFYIVDSDLRFAVWNVGSEKLLGRSAQETIGQVWSSRMFRYSDSYGQPLHDEQCPMNRVIADGRPATSTLKMQRPDGTVLDVELQSVPLLDASGQLHGVAEIIRDLSRSSRRPREFRELKIAASRDALTSVANRGELETQLAMMVSEFARQHDGEPFSAIFIDVDHFKSINDTYGHGTGDQVLIDLARLLQHETYSGEIVGRYGGEEFVVLCPATALDQAIRKAERLRIAVSRHDFNGLMNSRVTASFGVTQAETGDSVESVFRRADKALYMAKQGGRNKTCSLTNADLLAGERPTKETSSDSGDPFLFTSSFLACVAADMIVYKLGGFVNDQRAALKEVSAKRAIIQLGSRGVLPLWGLSDDRRPVELTVEFGEEELSGRGGVRAARKVPIQVVIRPVGWVRKAEVFQSRARSVLKLLRSYFVAT